MVDATNEEWDALKKNHPRLVKKWEDFREQYRGYRI